MAVLTASRSVDMLYVPEISDTFAFLFQPQYSLLLYRPSGEPHRIEYFFEIGQDIYGSYIYTGSNGYIYSVDGFSVTPENMDKYYLAFDSFGLRSEQFKGNDLIQGSPEGDRLVGLGGNDWIRGYGGGDDINGNTGFDTVFGDFDSDFVRGGQGNDYVYGGDGNDWHVNGNIGNDQVFGNLGSDSVFGGQGNDVLYGDDFVYGIGGNDYIQGDDGNDILVGDPGNDTLVGGSGQDTFSFYSGDGNDLILDFAISSDVIELEKNINGFLYTIGTPFSVLQERFFADGFGSTIIDLGAGNSVKIISVLPNHLQAYHFDIIT